jgi:hypothetical protein
VRRAIQQHVINPLAVKLLELGDEAEIQNATVRIDAPQAQGAAAQGAAGGGGGAFWGRPAKAVEVEDDMSGGGLAGGLEITVTATLADPDAPAGGAPA